MQQPITPESIAGLQFRNSLRGYDVNAIDLFLDQARQRVAAGQPAAAGPRPAFPTVLKGYDAAEVERALDWLGYPPVPPPPATPAAAAAPASAVVEPKRGWRRLFGG